MSWEKHEKSVELGMFGTLKVVILLLIVFGIPLTLIFGGYDYLPEDSPLLAK